MTSEERANLRYGTQDADVYALAILMQCILFRSEPFFLPFPLKSEDIAKTVEAVKLGNSNPYRPIFRKTDGELKPMSDSIDDKKNETLPIPENRLDVSLEMISLLSNNNGMVKQVVIRVMTKCWSENSADRPEARVVVKRINSINCGKKLNIMDVITSKLDKLEFTKKYIIYF